MNDEDESDFYRLYKDLPHELSGVVTAIEMGGGQCCDTAGVLRALRKAGFRIITLKTEDLS